MRGIFTVTLLILAMLSVAACSGSAKTAAPTQQPSATVPAVSFGAGAVSYQTAGGAARSISVEIASTGVQTERGLGYRDSLPADSGMIFDLKREGIPAFWMKGMRFALDMVWVGADKRVVSVTADIPPQPGVPDAQLKSYRPGAPAPYVLELNAGAARRLGIVAGTQLTFDLTQ